MTALELRNEPAAYVERRIGRDQYGLYARDFAGDEPAFVLMHGFPDNLRIYDTLAPLLAADGHRVITFDFLGYGGSDKPREYSYITANLEGDLETVVQALGLGPIVPVAHDASGPTAINWSLDHPDQVTALALLNTYYGASPSLRFPEFVSLFADPAYAELAAAFAADPAQFGWLLAFQASQFQRDAPPELRQRAQQNLVPVITSQFSSPPSAISAFSGLTRELRTSVDANTQRALQLASFAPPVRLIWGGGDPYLSVGVSQELRELFPHATLTVLQAGHWPQIDAPEDVAPGLVALLNADLPGRS